MNDSLGNNPSMGKGEVLVGLFFPFQMSLPLIIEQKYQADQASL